MLYFHKGLSRRACRTVGRALTLAGREGCPAADTGHLLLAMLETVERCVRQLNFCAANG